MKEKCQHLKENTMPLTETKEKLSRELIASRFAQKCRDAYRAGISYYSMFELSVLAPEVLIPLVEYNDGNPQVQTSIRALSDHSWTPDTIIAILNGLDIFSKNDTGSILWGFQTGSIDDSFDKIFKAYNGSGNSATISNKLVSREVIVMRFTENCLTSLNSGAELYSTFAIAITDQEITALLTEYGKIDTEIQKSIDTLINHSWNTPNDLKTALQGLSVFSDYDVYLIITGFISGNLKYVLTTILEQYRYCYNV